MIPFFGGELPEPSTVSDRQRETVKSLGAAVANPHEPKPWRSGKFHEIRLERFRV